MPLPESPVGLQSDNVAPAGAVRTISALVLVNGVVTPVQMQVVVPADGTGSLLQEWGALTDPMQAVRSELREIRILLARQLGDPVIPDSLPPFDSTDHSF